MPLVVDFLVELTLIIINMKSIIKSLNKKYKYSGSLKKNILLILVYELGSIYFIFINYNFIFLLISLFWLPIYYLAYVYSKLLMDLENFSLEYSIPTTTKEASEKFLSLLFYIPFIGPIIAMLRINYLQNEIEKRRKK